MNTQVQEVSLPQNRRSALASTLWACNQFAAGITDLLIHENAVIRAKTASGVVPLSEVGPLPGANTVIGADEIKHFFASYVDNISSTASASNYWRENIQPRLDRMEPINRSIELPQPAGSHGGATQLRISLFKHGRGRLGMGIRMVTHPSDLDKVGLPAALIQRIKQNPKGLLVLTGATGSGKTRTAYSILEYLNKHSEGHIVTIEDPIELTLNSDGCVVTQREVGSDVASFGEGLREAMRQAPEAILAGEVRDQDAAETAVLGGESGALMLVTTHGRSLIGTLKKLLTLCGERDGFRSVLATNLIAIARLELVPHTDGSQFTLINETLMGTAKVSQLLEEGDWRGLEQLCARADSTSGDYFSMKPQIDHLVRSRAVSLEAANKLGVTTRT